jgi:hypothetical protein
MVQWYINSRPVPKAIARVHLENAMPYRTAREIAKAMASALKDDEFFVKVCANHGVSVSNLTN